MLNMMVLMKVQSRAVSEDASDEVLMMDDAQ
jgi:hypothetical protein